MKDFCESLHLSVQSNQLLALIDEHTNTDAICIERLDLIDVFGKNILAFNSKNQEIKVGQEILVKRNSEPKCFLRTIKSIRLNDYDLHRCPAYINKPIGVALGKGILANYEYYLISAK